jgi:HAE1 family hydrophobic/amphiphilic exporter-1
VIQALENEGLPGEVRMRLAGTADKLTQTWNAMVIELMLALAIVYLVMAVLFESFLYPLIILLSVPLAAAGGVGGLVILNNYHFQPLDMLTLLGFVILIGIVVNNAILLLPLVLFPGAGSELYRGLGSVVVGGLSLSAVLTLLIIPPMLSMLVGTLEKGGRREGPEPLENDRSVPAPGE